MIVWAVIVFWLQLCYCGTESPVKEKLPIQAPPSEIKPTEPKATLPLKTELKTPEVQTAPIQTAAAESAEIKASQEQSTDPGHTHLKPDDFKQHALQVGDRLSELLKQEITFLSKLSGTSIPDLDRNTVPDILSNFPSRFNPSQSMPPAMITINTYAEPSKKTEKSDTNHRCPCTLDQSTTNFPCKNALAASSPGNEGNTPSTFVSIQKPQESTTLPAGTNLAMQKLEQTVNPPFITNHNVLQHQTLHPPAIMNPNLQIPQTNNMHAPINPHEQTSQQSITPTQTNNQNLQTSQQAITPPQTINGNGQTSQQTPETQITHPNVQPPQQINTPNVHPPHQNTPPHPTNPNVQPPQQNTPPHTDNPNIQAPQQINPPNSASPNLQSPQQSNLPQTSNPIGQVSQQTHTNNPIIQAPYHHSPPLPDNQQFHMPQQTINPPANTNPIVQYPPQYYNYPFAPTLPVGEVPSPPQHHHQDHQVYHSRAGSASGETSITTRETTQETNYSTLPANPIAQ